jgi:hypothetical protein
MSPKPFPQSEGNQKSEGGPGDQITISSLIRSSNVKLISNLPTISSEEGKMFRTGTSDDSRLIRR